MSEVKLTCSGGLYKARQLPSDLDAESGLALFTLPNIPTRDAHPPARTRIDFFMHRYLRQGA